MADSPLTPQEQAELNKGLTAANRLLKQRIDILKVISTFSKDSNAAMNNDIKLRKEVLKQFESQRKAIAELHAVNASEAQIERQRLKTLIDGTMHIEKQEALIKKVGAAWDIVSAKRANDVELLKKQGKIAQAAAQEIANSFKSQGPGAQNAAHAAASGAVKVHGAMDDPASMLEALGPWGILVKIIADVIDGARIMGAALHRAGAESGNFVKGYGTAAAEAMKITYQQTDLMWKYGMSTEEVSNLYQDLKNTGVGALGVVPKIGDALSETALNTMAFAKASGQTSAQVAGQMAMLTRLSKTSVVNLGTAYDKIFSMAERVAQAGVAGMSETIQATFSMAQQFSDIGMSISGISDVIDGVAGSIKRLGQGGGIENLTRISQGILGLSKAGEGWQSFMGQMSGLGGDFLTNLFRSQQRGPDMMNHASGAGSVDPIKNLEMFQRTMQQTAGKSVNPMQGQLIAEHMAAAMGIDRQTADIMLKMNPKEMRGAKGQEELKKIQQAAEDNNMSSKGMFDILRAILIGLIAKPLMWIWKHFASGDGDESQNQLSDSMDKLNAADKSAGGSGAMKGRNAGGYYSDAINADVKRSGAVRTRNADGTYNLETDTKGKDAKGHNVTNITIKVVDEHGKVLRIIKKQQAANTGASH